MSEWNPENQLPSSFFSVAQHVYANDEHWIKESEAQLQTLFSSEHRFFNGKNKVWLDIVDESTRLAGFYNPDQLVEGKKVAYFGYWETLNSFNANKMVFDRFESWAKECGAEVIYGPINFNTFGLYRLRLTNHQNGYFPGEPYNPEYYPELMGQLGYGVSKRFYSWFGLQKGKVELAAPMMEPALKNLEEQGVKFSRLTPDFWLNNLPEIFKNVDEIFKDNFAYTGISFEEFEKSFGQSFVSRFCPESSVLAMGPDNKIAGFFVAFPDYSPLVKQSAVHKISAAELNFNEHFKLLETPMALGKSGGVSPAFRKSGLFSAMSYLMMQWLKPSYTYGAATLVREDNPSARVGKMFFSQPGDWSHEYALFSKDL